MSFISLNKEDATASHQSFYDGDFEVMPMERCNFWDFFPINLINVFVELPGMDNWNGIISTDGKKVVITESKWSNLAKHKKVFTFEVNDIESISDGYRKIGINFHQPIKKLTMASINPIIKLILFFGTIGIIALLTSFVFKGKLLEIELDDQFENEKQFKNLLNI
jgi:hypothetical protein